MRVARKAQAAQFAANVLPIIWDIQAAGHTSLNAIAGQLNARKVGTANGGQWRHVQVRQILGSGVCRCGMLDNKDEGGRQSVDLAMEAPSSTTASTPWRIAGVVAFDC
jgi:recombinase